MEGTPPAPAGGGEEKSAGAPAGRKTEYVSPQEQAAAPKAPPVSGRRARKTVYVPPPDETDAATSPKSGEARVATPLPRLVGFLVTYSWEKSGESFSVREGKNTFGSDPVLCDGALTRDRAMSGQHFAVMVRGGKFRVRDLDSTNATRVDDEEIWGDSVEAHHASTIRAGDTRFQLVLIPPQSQDA